MISDMISNIDKSLGIIGVIVSGTGALFIGTYRLVVRPKIKDEFVEKTDCDNKHEELKKSIDDLRTDLKVGFSEMNRAIIDLALKK